MKVGPKSLLRPLLHRALQLLSEIEENSDRIFTDMGSQTSGKLCPSFYLNCFSCHTMRAPLLSRWSC